MIKKVRLLDVAELSRAFGFCISRLEPNVLRVINWEFKVSMFYVFFFFDVPG